MHLPLKRKMDALHLQTKSLEFSCLHIENNKKFQRSLSKKNQILYKSKVACLGCVKRLCSILDAEKLESIFELLLLKRKDKLFPRVTASPFSILHNHLSLLIRNSQPKINRIILLFNNFFRRTMPKINQRKPVFLPKKISFLF